MGDTGGLHVGNCASNITSISTARRGYTDRTEAAIETLVGTVTVRIPLGIDAATLRWYCAPENYYGPNPDDASHVLRSAPLRSAHLRFLNRVSMMLLICASLSLGE